MPDCILQSGIFLSSESDFWTSWACWQSMQKSGGISMLGNKKTPLGVNGWPRSFFWGSKRLPKGGSGPPLPLSLVVRRVSNCGIVSGWRKYLRTRFAVPSRPVDIQTPSVWTDAAEPSAWNSCPAIFSRHACPFHSGIFPEEGSCRSLSALPNTPRTTRCRCGKTSWPAVLSLADKHRDPSPCHSEQRPA